MIALLSGKLIHKSPGQTIIDVNGIGYEVLVPLSTFSCLPDIGSNTTLFTHTYLREDQLSLFGFATDEEREIFLKLIKINGVGPKLALSILSGISILDLKIAITSENSSRLQMIPGIGRKTAERIVIELKDKIKTETSPNAKYNTQAFDDALSALVNLGYQRTKVVEVLRKLPWGKNMSAEEAIRAAFKELK